MIYDDWQASEQQQCSGDNLFDQICGGLALRFVCALAKPWSPFVEGDEGPSGKLLCLWNAKTMETVHDRH